MNNFTGTIPATIGLLTNLDYMYELKPLSLLSPWIEPLINWACFSPTVDCDVLPRQQLEYQSTLGNFPIGNYSSQQSQRSVRSATSISPFAPLFALFH